MDTLVHEMRQGLCVEDQRCAVRTAEGGCDCARIADYIDSLKHESERLRTALTEIADLIDQVFVRGLDPFLLGQVKGRVTQVLGPPAPPQR